MYLHIGGDIAVKIKDIIAVMDLETSSVSKITKDFLKIAQKSNSVINVNNELPKSYVVTNSDGETRVYISPISSHTLLKRTENSKKSFI